MKTLIAEDDAANRRLLEVTLTRWGHQVVTARDGNEAWQAFEVEDNAAPQLAILDWMMPGRDGPDVCRLIRERPNQPYVYVLLLTARDQKRDFLAGMDAGADDYLVKPFDPNELQARLRAGQRVLDLQAQLLAQNVRLEQTARSERAAHDALKQAQSHLVQSEKMIGLGQMVAGVAHEINNPLAFVTSNMAVLERDVKALEQILALYGQGDAVLAREQPDLAAGIRDLAERVDLAYTLTNLSDLLARSRDGLRRIQNIVRDLRDFARLDAGDRQEADINKGVASTLNIIAGRARARSVRLESDLLPDLPPVRCFPAKINQVVMNLLANGIDASPPGGAVTVRTRRASDDPARAIEIVVEDAGPGIDPSVRERIFDPFVTTKPIGEGTGLGLSISYGIVRDHGGTITVDAAPGGGARFTVRLPLDANE